jgi:hypothetical protein
MADLRNALARAVLDGGPFAMRKAEELAEVVLGEVGELRSAPNGEAGHTFGAAAALVTGLWHLGQRRRRASHSARD